MQKSFYILVLNALIFGGCAQKTTPPEPREPEQTQETVPPLRAEEPSQAESSTKTEEPPQAEPSTKTKEASKTESSAQTQDPQSGEPSGQTRQAQGGKSSAFPLPLQRFFGGAPSNSLSDLQSRQAKAERLADDDKFAEAVSEADYVVSSILAGDLHRRGVDGKHAQEFANLLDSALATLDDCAARAEATQDPVLSSEPTSVRL